MTAPTTSATSDDDLTDKDPAGKKTSPVMVTTGTVALGHLFWLVWVWLLATVVFAVILVFVDRNGDVSESIWQHAAAGWQRWPIVGAGVVTTFTMVPMLVTMGVTRRQFFQGAAWGWGILTALATTFIVVGYAVESFIYDRGGWPQQVSGDVEFVGATDLVELAVETWPLMAAYYLTGWLLGLVYYRSTEFGVALTIPCLLPAGAAELLLTAEFASTDFLPFGDDGIPLVVGVTASLIVLAMGAVAARWAMLQLEIRSA